LPRRQTPATTELLQQMLEEDAVLIIEPTLTACMKKLAATIV
jgi:hypothetical protein